MKSVPGCVLLIGHVTDAESIIKRHEWCDIVRHNKGDYLELMVEALSRRKYPHLDVVVYGDELAQDPVIQQAVTDGINLAKTLYVTTVEHAERWTRESVPLLTRLAKGKTRTVLDLRDAAKGATGIIVGSGPSLSREIEALKAVAGSAIVGCCNTAVPALRAAGIVPDFIAGLESKDEAYSDVDGPAGDELMLLGPQVSSAAWERFESLGYDPILIPITSGPAGSIVCEKLGGKLDTGGSVSTAVASVLAFIGCSEIWGIGIDCAIPEKRYYADGISTEYKPTLAVTVKGRDAGDLPSSTVLNSYRLWFEAFAVKHEEIMFVNACTGGAEISHWINDKLRLLRQCDDPGLFEAARDMQPMKAEWVQPLLEAELELTTRDAENNAEIARLARELTAKIAETADDKTSRLSMAIRFPKLEFLEYIPTSLNLDALAGHADQCVAASHTVADLIRRGIIDK